MTTAKTTEVDGIKIEAGVEVGRLAASLLSTSWSLLSIQRSTMSISQAELASLANLPRQRQTSSSSRIKASASSASPSAHGRTSSSDFGDFARVVPSHVALQDDDLLRSFDDEPHPSTSPSPVNQQQSRPGPSTPLHINLPPRPSEIRPDYIPPPRQARRPSQTYLFPGPSSPPLVTTVGHDIVFHPSRGNDDNDVFGMQHQPPTTRASQTSSSHPTRTQSRLLNTLATTNKVASKWKSVLDPATFESPIDDLPSSSIPIGITHTTPFASAEQIAGSYSAPSGAPGFDPHAEGQQSRPGTGGGEGEWPNVVLLGRREGTHVVMTQSLADHLRRKLPPRQRLSRQWSLICTSRPCDAAYCSAVSLDQHGASLATLYRLAEQSTSRDPSRASVLVVEDGRGNAFGTFLNENIVRREGTYYGSGESFVSLLRAAGADAAVDFCSRAVTRRFKFSIGPARISILLYVRAVSSPLEEGEYCRILSASSACLIRVGREHMACYWIRHSAATPPQPAPLSTTTYSAMLGKSVLIVHSISTVSALKYGVYEGTRTCHKLLIASTYVSGLSGKPTYVHRFHVQCPGAAL